MNLEDSKMQNAINQGMVNAKMEEAIIGALKQVGVVGISFGFKVAHPGAIQELPETIVISKFSAMGNKVFYHLAITSQAENIGGTMYVLHGIGNALLAQTGQGENPPMEKPVDLSPGNGSTGDESSNEGSGPGQETTPSPDLQDT